LLLLRPLLIPVCRRRPRRVPPRRRRGPVEPVAKVVRADAGHDGVVLDRRGNALTPGRDWLRHAAEQDVGGEALPDDDSLRV
jgi:hypothetical protein